MGGRPLREAPAEFAVKAVDMTWDEARKHWGCGAATLTRWMSETGAKLRVINPELRGHKLRPMPNDFRKYGHVESLKALCVRYTTGPDVVRRWRNEVGAKPLPMNKMRPIPADFKENAALFHREKLSVMYQCGQPVLSRWYDEAGLVPKEYQAGVGKIWHGKATGSVPQMPTPARDDTIAGEAADFLKRKGWVGVYNVSRVHGGSDKKLWQVGRYRMAETDMIDKAARGGFQRREMM